MAEAYSWRRQLPFLLSLVRQRLTARAGLAEIADSPSRRNATLHVRADTLRPDHFSFNLPFALALGKAPPTVRNIPEIVAAPSNACLPGCLGPRHTLCRDHDCKPLPV